MNEDRHVYWHKATEKWVASIHHRGKRHHLGLFGSKKAASDAACSFRDEHDIEHDPKAPLKTLVYYRDGNLYWRRHGPGHEKDGLVGCVDARSGYRCLRTRDGKTYLHRLTWELLVGPIPPGLEVDHINGERMDNRIENLRIVTRALNMKNTKRRTDLFPGVSRTPSGRFLARYQSGGQLHYLGRFDTFEEAVQARITSAADKGFHPNHGRKE